jgi:hypothetical protein
MRWREAGLLVRIVLVDIVPQRYVVTWPASCTDNQQSIKLSDCKERTSKETTVRLQVKVAHCWIAYSLIGNEARGTVPRLVPVVPRHAFINPIGTGVIAKRHTCSSGRIGRGVLKKQKDERQDSIDRIG